MRLYFLQRRARRRRVAPPPPRASHVPPPRVVDDDDIPRSAYQHIDLERTAHLPRSIMCPITHAPMKDPLLAADGHSYERAAILKWLAKHPTSPVTNTTLPSLLLFPNHALRNTISELLDVNGQA